MIFKISLCAALAALGTLPVSLAHADVNELRITKQPGALFTPIILMEQHKLIEKHAAAAGLGNDFKVSWLTLSSGGAATDGLLAGSVDIVTSGTTNMLLLWGKTNGDVKAVAGISGLPFKLITRNPNIKTIKDYGPGDRIALPTVRVSIQAMTLGIALQKAYGDDKANEKLLPNQVQMGHPDATAALLNPMHEVTSHFSASPFQEMLLKNPSMHTVLESRDALGGGAHIAIAFSTTKFFQANPKVIAAFIAAAEEATEMVRKDPRAAATTYLGVTKEKLTVDEMVALLTQPEAIFQVAPVRTMVYATYMYKAGFIKLEPKSWKDYFFPPLHNREGS
ncbi:MAG TPA: ABC transporter substrate-binding protein [Hyphomicrobiaceae bacterium]|nr:ABC transporter substrate-binding protein [Hyphomicrobiaceae bacterium]